MRAIRNTIAGVVVGVLFLGTSASGQNSGKPNEPRPNIIVIVTDDQRADSLRYMHATKRLFMRGGTTFANAYATTPVCCPARASILTGRYVHNHGVRTQQQADAPAAEAAEELMIQKELKAAGYTTGLFGKFLNNWNLENDPEHLDKWAIFGHSAPYGYRNGTWNVNGRLKRILDYSTTYLRDRATGFIKAQEKKDGRPWFLYVAPAAPHRPFDAERRYNRMAIDAWAGNPAVFEEDRTDKPIWVQQNDKEPYHGVNIRAKQLRTLMSVDDLVGSLVRKLQRLDESRRTLLIFMSDNGFMWSEHGLGTKRWPYLPSVKIPLMMRWPGTVARGAVDERLVANIDVAPTIAQLAGVNLQNADGRSLLSAHERARLLLEYFPTDTPAPPEWASTITKEIQYIEYYENGLLVQREYYDLVNDPWQLVNLLGDPDPTNDPSLTESAELMLQLDSDRQCAGPNECP